MEGARATMVVASISIFVCACVCFLLTVCAGMVTHAKPVNGASRDELAPLVSSVSGMGISMSNGLSAMAAAVSQMEVAVSSKKYAQRTGFPTDMTAASCAGKPTSAVAGLSRFASIVRAVAGIAHMQTSEMCASGAIATAVAHLKRKLTGASCQGVVDAMNSSSASAGELTRSAVAELALAIADATCVTNEINAVKLNEVLDGVAAAMCPASEPAGSDTCIGIASYMAETTDVYVKRLVRAIAAAARAYAIERSRCKETIARVDAMDFTAIAQLVRNRDITIACARIGKKMAASTPPAAADAVASVVRSALVSVVCADHSALALMTPTDLKGLVVSIVRAMCAGDDKVAAIMIA
jgi:hypothetical protein